MDDDIHLPEACPWGIAVYSDFGKEMLGANQHMHAHYFDAGVFAPSVDHQFRFRSGGGWDLVVAQLK